jgi:type IV pilus assembly protein PilE
MHTRTPLRHQQGITLIELMIVVAIIAIISAVAYPSYTNYVARASRAEAREFIMRVAQAQERFYTARNTYTAEIAGADGLNFGTTSSTNGSRYYTTSVALGPNGQTYTITAAPQANQAGDKCGSLTLTNTGQKGFTGDETNGSCW